MVGRLASQELFLQGRLQLGTARRVDHTAASESRPNIQYRAWLYYLIISFGEKHTELGIGQVQR